MKLAVFTACLPDFDLEEQCKLLNKNGYEGIELRLKDVTPEQKTKPFSFWGNHKNDLGIKNLTERAKQVRKICDKYKIEICALGSYMNVDDFEAIEEVCKNLKTLGVNQFRVGGMNGWIEWDKDNYTEKFKHFSKSLAKAVKLAEKYKARLTLETHPQTIHPSVGLVYRLVSQFDPKNVGVILDPGNMVGEGYEQITMQLDLLKSYVAHVHFKNSRWVIKEVLLDGTVKWEHQGCSMWEGIVNAKYTMEQLKKYGYDKWLSMEDFTAMDAVKKVETFAKYVRSQMPV